MSENNITFGSVKIAEDVIGSIAIMAAAEVEGVRFQNNQNTKSLKKNAKKYIKLTYDEQILIIDVYIIVKYGFHIPKVAAAVQENVLNSVESMAGVKVKNVNVHCTGIVFSKENAKMIK